MCLIALKRGDRIIRRLIFIAFVSLWAFFVARLLAKSISESLICSTSKFGRLLSIEAKAVSEKYLK